MSLVHLHRHSEFSPLDGMGNAEQYAERAVELGQTALGLTDHATMGGALHHVRACRENDLTPVIGVEAYFRDDRHATKDDGQDHNAAMHLCLHASSMKGWHSLLRITSAAYTQGDKEGHGFYGKPVVDWDLLERYNEGLFCSTACIYGPINEAILNGNHELAAQRLERLAMVFKSKSPGDRMWIEIMPHDFEPQRTANLHALNLSMHYGIPVIATGDAHMPYKEWSDTHLILQMHATRQTMAKREQKKVAGEDVYGSELDTLYLMSEGEMFQAFKDHHPDIPRHVVANAIGETAEMVRRMRMYVIDRDQKLPRVVGVDNAEQTLREWCDEGMKRIGRENDTTYVKRLEYEFGVLKKNDVIDYFIIVGDFMRWMKSDEGLPNADDPLVNVGRKEPIRASVRGSAAGCLISYLIGISPINPITYGLLFERFLNPDRKGLPDIDIDVDADRRDEAKEYLKRLYGEEHVADVIAWTNFAPRALIDDLGRIYGLGYTELEGVKKALRPTDRGLIALAEKHEPLRKFLDDHPDMARHMERLDGQVHRASKHAAALIITERPVNEHVPLQLNKGTKGDSVVTAFADSADFPIISDFGLLKMDVLGLATLTRQQMTMEMVRQTDPDFVDPRDLPVWDDPATADPAVLEMFAEGRTIGTFQFTGRGITKLLRRIKPDSVNDLIAANALYRPGAMKVANDYADRKNGKVPESEWYWHPAVEPFLRETYGVLAYQEQVMELVKALGDFTGGEADSMRKAISKWYRLGKEKCQEKIRDLGFEDKWLEGCERHGVDRTSAMFIWDQIMEWAGYGFNKSHSAVYALTAYGDMHEKVYKRNEMFASLFTRPSKEKGFVESAVREARDLGVEIIPPDVNLSDMAFRAAEGRLVYGLAAVRDIGDKAARDIIEDREANGPFRSYSDFAKRLPAHAKKAGIPLIKAGGFDALHDREWLLAMCEKAINAKKEAELRESGEELPRWTVAEHINHNRKLKNPRPIPDHLWRPSSGQLREWEIEMLGARIGGPRTIAENRDVLDQYVYSEDEFDSMVKDDEIVVAGEIVELKEKKTRRGDTYAIMELAYGPEEYSCKLWPEVYRRYADTLHDADAVIAFGVKDVWNDRESVTVQKLENAAHFADQHREE